MFSAVGPERVEVRLRSTRGDDINARGSRPAEIETSTTPDRPVPYNELMDFSPTLRRSQGFRTHLTRSLLLAILWSPAANELGAQILPGAETGASTEEVRTEIVLAQEEIVDAWVEITPLAVGPEAAHETFPTLADQERRLRPDLPVGPALLCSGARNRGTSCRAFFLYRGPAGDFRGELEVTAAFAPGRPITAEVRQRAFPVEGAEVRVVPAGLATLRPFSLPLTPDPAGSQPIRALRTDTFGRFETPAIAPGTYFLEIRLPSGRLYRGQEFILEGASEDDSRPTDRPGAGEREDDSIGSSLAEEPEPFDLGRIDIDEGLALEARLLDPADQPIPDAVIEARQGTHLLDLVTFEQLTDSAGEARLAGFSAEQPVTLRFGARGFRAAELTFDLLPARIEAILEPFATLEGEVLVGEGDPAAGARVSLQAGLTAPAAVSFPEASEVTSVPSAESLAPQAIDDDGRFRFVDLVAGEYELIAAAPGRAVYRTSLRIEPGERLRLDPISLLSGREVDGRVVDKGTREGLAGVTISAKTPAGAVETESGADGRFRFFTASEEPLELLFTGEGHAENLLHLEPERLADDQPLEVELEPAGWILATVADGTEAQLPCQGCRLLLSPGEHPLTTDPEGEALSQPLAPGRYRLGRPSVVHLGSTAIEQTDAEIREVRVTAGEITTVRFGEPREAISLTFDPAWDPRWSLVLRAPGRSERVLPRADGSFPVTRRPGETPRLFARFFDSVAGRDGELYQGDLPATISEDELVIPRHSTRFHGRVEVDGVPRSGLRIQLLDLTGEALGSLWTGDDGTFSASHVPIGVYSLQLEDRAIGFLSLRDGLDLDLGTFDLPDGSF